MESLLQLRKRLSHWSNDDGGASGTGTQLVKKIKIVSSDGTLKYNFVDESQPPLVNRVTQINGSEYFPDTKANSPFVIRIEAPKQQTGNFQNTAATADTKVLYLKSDPQDQFSQNDTLRRCTIRQRRCQNPSLTDDEVRAAYAKLKLTPPSCSYEEMNESERGIYRFVRRRLMNKNSARQSRLRRKELFKEYENTIQLQTERIERSENRLRLLFACFINAVTLIALQSMPQLVRNGQSAQTSDALISADCPNCQRNELFSSAMLDAVHMFGGEVYDDMEGIDQLVLDLRVCGADRPIKQLLQRQERSLSSVFNANGIKDVLSNAGIPQWKLNMLTANALRSAWSIFLGPEDQALLYDDANQTAKQEPSNSAAYFESFVNELFDPVKHAELINAISGGGDCGEPPDPRL